MNKETQIAELRADINNLETQRTFYLVQANKIIADKKHQLHEILTPKLLLE